MLKVDSPNSSSFVDPFEPFQLGLYNFHLEMSSYWESNGFNTSFPVIDVTH